MSKKSVRVFIILFAMIQMIVFSYVPVSAKDFENINDLGLTSESCVLMEASTGSIIYENNSHEKLPPASITKIMTLILIYDAVEAGKIKWEDMVTVSEHAASMGGSQVFLEPMEQQTVKDMTKCISIASANDASVAMAEYIGGSEDGFVAMMNGRAKGLGMNDTNFENACGLDTDGHITTAYDIALMSRELITKYPDIFTYTTTWQDTIIHKTKKGDSEFGLTNTNKLIKWYSGATGLKTGSTGKAKYCVSGTAEKNGMSLIGVVMACPNPQERFREVMKLFDYGYANYGMADGLPKGESAGEIPIYKGVKELAPIVIKDDFKTLIQKGNSESMETEINILPSLNAPVEAGTKAGEIIYKIDNEEVGRMDLIVSEGVSKINLFSMIKRLMGRWCGSN